MQALALVAAGVLAVLPQVAASAAPAKAASQARDWTKVVVATPDGGYRIGNPQAKVKLIEYASVWCPHCKHFNDTGVPQLKAKYVATGKVSYEIRNFVLNPMDLPATLLVRCDPAPAPYMKMLEAFYARQAEWEAPIVEKLTADPDALNKLGIEDPNKAALLVGRWAGLDNFAKSLGVTEARFTACLTDKAATQRIADQNNLAVTAFDLKATPLFAINGRTLDNTNTWEELEPQLRAAL